MPLVPALLRRLPGGLLHALRRSALARRLVRRLVVPLLPGTVTVGRGLARGLRLRREGALVSYLLGLDEPGVQAAFERLVEPGMVAWDVGANIGYFSLILARLVGEGGSVVAFEPRPTAAARVREHAALNGFDRIEVVERAAGRASGRATFHLRAQPTASSLAAGGGAAVDAIEVDVAALDDLAGLRPPQFVKIDVEGGEVDALIGMGRILAEAGPILVIENHGLMGEVQAVLDGADYAVRVLGDDRPLPEAAWNAIVVAVPAARRELLDRVAGIADRR